MKLLTTGAYFGEKKKVFETGNIIFTEVSYPLKNRADWHFHENPFFSFLLEGKIFEGTKKGKDNYLPGTLLFQNSEEPHYNACLQNNTQSFYVEIKRPWLNKLSFTDAKLPGNTSIRAPEIKLLFHSLYKELNLSNPGPAVAMEASVIQLIALLVGQKARDPKAIPRWVNKLDDILHECPSEKVSLEGLSHELGVHPVHICQDFKRYFGCNLGQYLRKLKVEKSLTLLYNKAIPLIDIAYECGFADQSHFIRCFKDIARMTPSQYRKTVVGA